VKIVEDYPPNYDAICEAIPDVKDKNDVVFTYGDTIYNPYKGEVQDHLEAHEAIHELQQKAYGLDEWWGKYLSDKKFRLEQEIEAYRVQYQFVNKTYGRGAATGLLREIATDLSGGMYGYLLDRKSARKEIIKK
jgi:hypothetical protein